MSDNPKVSASFAHSYTLSPEISAVLREQINNRPPNDFGTTDNRLVKSKQLRITEEQPSVAERNGTTDVSKLENWLIVSHEEYQRALKGESVWVRHPTYGNKLLCKWLDRAWHCRWVRDNRKAGQSKYEIKSTRCGDWIDAIARSAKLYEGRHAAAAVLFAKTADEWHRWGRTKKLKQRTDNARAVIGERLKRHLIPLLGHVAIEDFSDATMMTYRRNHEARSAMPATDPLYIPGKPTDETIYSDTQIVLAIIDYAKRMLHVKLKHEPPALGPRCEARRATTNDEMFERLAHVARLRIRNNHRTKEWWGRTFLRFNILTLRYTGCRPGEGRKLRIGDIGREINSDGFVPVWIEYPAKDTGKRTTYADPRILNVLAEILAVHPTPNDPKAPIFVTITGTRVKEYHNTFKSLLDDMQEREPKVNWLIDYDDHNKPENRTLYSLRHAYATAMLVTGKIGLVTLSQLMGTDEAYIKKHYWHKLKETMDQATINRVEGKMKVEKFAA